MPLVPAHQTSTWFKGKTLRQAHAQPQVPPRTQQHPKTPPCKQKLLVRARPYLQNIAFPPGTDKKSKSKPFTLDCRHAPINPPLTPGCCQCWRQHSQAGLWRWFMQYQALQLLVHHPTHSRHWKDAGIFGTKSPYRGAGRCRGGSVHPCPSTP